MKHTVLRAILILLILPFLSSCNTPGDNQWGVAATKTSDTVPLDQVISVTRNALDDYYKAAAKKGSTLPDLVSADFDFKTVVDTKAGIGVTLLIFTIGVTGDKQVTNDVDFLYMPKPPKPVTRFLVKGKPDKTFYQSLLDSLTAAGRAITNAQIEAVKTGVKLDFCQLTVTTGFSVMIDPKVSLTLPVLVAPSGSLEHSNNKVQQVKLTFKVKDQDPTVCADKNASGGGHPGGGT
jgi:hypothetical protein